MNELEKLKSSLLAKKKSSRISKGLSTGSTLLNLACTGNPDSGFLSGHYYLLVGDSASGKTFLSLTCLAEASISSVFDKHRFIYDNAEDGALMDVRKFFGKGVAKRIEFPGRTESRYSTTIEEFFYHVDDAFKEGSPFIYILDSMDALTSDDEAGKFQEQKTAARKGKDVSGSYGTSKAKANSSGFRRIVSQLQQDGKSIVIVVSQTRDNIGFGFEKRTRAGGRALRFYATIEAWSSIRGKLRKTVRGEARQVGIIAEIQVKKNRVTGRERSVQIPIYYSIGIDDLGSCIDWLVSEKHWFETKGKITAPEFEFTGSREKLVERIETSGHEIELRDLVASVWNEIERDCEIKRKPRYG